MSSVVSQLLAFNNCHALPMVIPDIVLTDLVVNNGESVSGSGSPDNLPKIGRVSRYPSIFFIE
jgi:hypothetical protein